LLHQLWLKGTSMIIIGVYSLAGATSCLSWSMDTYDEPWTVENTMSSKHSNKSELFQTVFQRFNDSSRFIAVPLSPLHKNVMKEFLYEYFEIDDSTHSLQKNDFNKVIEHSGGNPLYGIELMKSFLNSQLSSPKKGGTAQFDNETSSAVNEVAASSALNHRIEEVIYYRLDKLHPTIQSLLKAISVATSNGFPCTYEMISALLRHQDMRSQKMVSLKMMTSANTNSLTATNVSTKVCSLKIKALSMNMKHLSMNDLGRSASGSGKFLSIQDALVELVQDGIFLQLLAESEENGSGATDDTETFPAENFKLMDLKKQIEEKKFHFQIPVEQVTIYNLLIDEQKEYFHERLGFYWSKHFGSWLTKQQQPFTLTDSIAKERLEEAHHWEKAYLFPNGILAYLTAAEYYRVQSNESQYVFCVKSAFKLFRLIQNDMHSPLSVIAFDERAISFLKNSLDPLYEWEENDLKSLFMTFREQITTVFIFLEGFVDYLPVFIHLLNNALEVAILELDHNEVIDHIMGLKFSFVLSFYYCSLFVHKKQPSTPVRSGKIVLSDLKTLPFDTKSAGSNYNGKSYESELFPIPVSSFHSNFSLKEGYSLCSLELFQLSSVTTVRFLSSAYFAHFYCFPTKPEYSLLLSERKNALTEILVMFQETIPNNASRILNDEAKSHESDHVLLFKLQCVFMKLLKSLATATEDSETTNILSLFNEFISYQTYYLRLKKLWKKHFLVSYDTIILNLVKKKFYFDGDFQNYFQLVESGKADFLASSFQGHGLTVIQNCLNCLLFLSFPSSSSSSPATSQKALSLWSEYNQQHIDTNKMMKILPYSWKRLVDLFLKEIVEHTKSAEETEPLLPLVNNNLKTVGRLQSQTGISSPRVLGNKLADMQFNHISINNQFRKYFISYESMNFVTLFYQLTDVLSGNNSGSNKITEDEEEMDQNIAFQPLSALNSNYKTAKEIEVLHEQLLIFWDKIVLDYLPSNKTEQQTTSNPMNIAIPIIILGNHFQSIMNKQETSSAQSYLKEFSFLFQRFFANHHFLSIIHSFSLEKQVINSELKNSFLQLILLENILFLSFLYSTNNNSPVVMEEKQLQDETEKKEIPVYIFQSFQEVYSSFGKSGFIDMKNNTSNASPATETKNEPQSSAPTQRSFLLLDFWKRAQSSLPSSVASTMDLPEMIQNISQAKETLYQRMLK
jgi:hypothetical protein